MALDLPGLLISLFVPLFALFSALSPLFEESHFYRDSQRLYRFERLDERDPEGKLIDLFAAFGKGTVAVHTHMTSIISAMIGFFIILLTWPAEDYKVVVAVILFAWLWFVIYEYLVVARSIPLERLTKEGVPVPRWWLRLTRRKSTAAPGEIAHFNLTYDQLFNRQHIGSNAILAALIVLAHILEAARAP